MQKPPLNGADPLFSTNLVGPIIYRVFEPLNLSRGMDCVPLSIASIFIQNQVNYAMVSLLRLHIGPHQGPGAHDCQFQ